MRRVVWMLVCLAVALGLAGCGGVRGEKSAAARAADTNVQLAMGYFRQGRLDLARDKIDKALQGDPGHADAHSTAALIYEQLGEMEEAEAHHRRAAELTPKNGGLLNNYGVFLCSRGRYAEAEQQFVAALATPRYPTPESALENAGVCVKKGGNLQKAEEYFRAALRTNPKLPVSLLEMGQIMLDTQRTLNARAYLQRFEAAAAPTPQALWLGMQVETQLGNGDAAEAYAVKLSSMFPDSAEVKRLLGMQQGGRP